MKHLTPQMGLIGEVIGRCCAPFSKRGLCRFKVVLTTFLAFVGISLPLGFLRTS